jgi:lipopolysaccharide export system permease protein
LRPLFALLLPVALVLLTVSMYLSPLAAGLTRVKLEAAFRNAAEWGLQTGTFHVLRSGNLVLYVAAVERDGRSLRHVFIQQRNEDREQVWAAEKGYYWLDRETGHRYLTLENGQITEGRPGSLDFGIMEFSRNDLRLPDPEERGVADTIETRKSTSLLFTGQPEDAAEFQWRLSPALAAIVLGLLAIPLSHSAPREGRGGRALLGILAYTVYVNVLYMCRNWLAKGDLPAFPGMLWVHLLVFVIVLFWLQRQGRMVGRG